MSQDLTRKEAQRINAKLYKIQNALHAAIQNEFGSLSIYDFENTYFKPDEHGEHDRSYTIALSYFGVPYNDESAEQYTKKVLDAARLKKKGQDIPPHTAELKIDSDVYDIEGASLFQKQEDDSETPAISRGVVQ